MQNFMYYAPTKVIFGRDTEKTVGQEIRKAGGTRVLVHYGSNSAKKSGLLDRIEESLKEAGISYIMLGGVEPNPKLALVRKGIALCLEEKVDFILAVGGGSAIDSSKAIAVGAKNPDKDIWDDMFIKKYIPAEKIPVACVLTLAAAGSEMSNSMVVTNENGIKRGFGDDLIRPLFAIMNPELTYSLPAYQTTCGCVDIMMHTMDRYFTPTEGNELTDMLAVAVLKTIIKYAPIALADPTNYDARSEIMWAGSLSHNTLTGLGAWGDWCTHQFGHELSGKYEATHGASLSAVWASWARYVYKCRPERFAQFGADVFGVESTGDVEQDALNGIAAAEAFFKSINAPISIGELLGHTISEEEIDEISYKCTFGLKRVIGSVKQLGLEEIKEVYRAANF